MTGSKLTPRKRQAVSALLKGKTHAEVASIVGVNERTLFRWRSEPSFKAELRRSETWLLEDAVLHLVNLSEDAVSALADVIHNPSQRGASVKRLAAKDVLEILLKWRDMVTFEERLTKLEETVWK